VIGETGTDGIGELQREGLPEGKDEWKIEKKGTPLHHKKRAKEGKRRTSLRQVDENSFSMITQRISGDVK